MFTHPEPVSKTNGVLSGIWTQNLRQPSTCLSGPAFIAWKVQASCIISRPSHVSQLLVRVWQDFSGDFFISLLQTYEIIFNSVHMF